MTYIATTYIYWLALKYTRQFCDFACEGTFWGVCGVAVFCYATTFFIILLISTGQIFDVDYNARDQFSDMTRYMFALLLLMLWGFIQYTCLYESYQQYQLQLERQEALQERELDRRAGIAVSNRPLGLARSYTMNYKNNCVYYGNIIGNTLLGVCFIIAEVLLLDQFQTAGENNEWELAATDLFITIFILLVMAFFIPLSASMIRYEDKQMYLFIFAGFCPVAILGGLYHPFIKNQEVTSGLIRMLLIFLPLFTMYVATLNYVRKQSDNIYRAYLTISGFGFILPSTVTYTLYYIGYYQIEDSMVVAGIILFAASTVIVIVFFMVYIIMKIKESCTVGYRFKDCDFVDSGTLVNVSGGIISVGVLIYVYVEVPEAPSIKRSTVFALVFLILFLAVCMNILLRLKVPKGILSHHLNLLFSSDRNEELEEKYYWEKLLQKVTLLVGVLCFPLIFLCLYFVVEADSEKICKIIFSSLQKKVFMAMVVGVVFVSLVFVFLLEVRKGIGIYAKNCLPLCTTCIWIFIILPLAVGAPAAIVYLGNSTTNYRYLSGMIISFLSVLLMVGVSVGAIVLTYVFKQMELENKAKYCVKYLRAQLTKIAVRGDEGTLRQLYDQHQLHGANVVTESLNRKVVYFWTIADKDPDIYHNKILVPKEKYDQLMELANKSNKKPKEIEAEKLDEQKEKPKKDLKFCCSCCYESDDEEEAVKETKPEQKLEDAIIKKEPAAESVVDFKYLLERIKQGDVGSKDGEFVANTYVKPYSAIDIFGASQEYGNNKEITYEQFIDIVEDRKVNSEKLLELLLNQEGCTRRYYDQLFRAFAKGPLNEYPYMWMTQADFIDFCMQAGVIDTYVLTEGEICGAMQEFDILFASQTQRRCPLVMDRLSFDDALNAIAAKKFPNDRPDLLPGKLLSEIIYPGLLRSMPRLINERFAKNVMDSKFRVKGMYPDQGIDDTEEYTYIPSELKGSRYNFCRRMCIGINKALNSVLSCMLICFGAIATCFKSVLGCFQTSHQKEDDAEPTLANKNRSRLPPAVIRKRLPDAGWPLITSTIVKSIEEGIEQYERLHQEQEHEFSFNSANLVAITNEVYGTYVMASLAFNEKVGWELPSLTNLILNYLKINPGSDQEASPSTFLSFFWVSFGLCFLYVLLAIPAARRARKGLLGYDNDGKAIATLSWGFITYNLVSLLGSGMYISIITNLFNVFACNYEVTPWSTYVVSGLTCWEGTHFLYIFCAALGIIVYYPMATFMCPNLQFQDKLLDLKFYPSFLVIMSQIMLFISGLACFYQDDIIVMLLFTASSMFLMGLLCLKMQPCLVKRANLWFTVKFFLISWITAGGAIMYLTKNKTLSWIFILTGSFGILAVAYLIQKLKYGTNGPLICFNLCCANKSASVIPENGELEMAELDKVNDSKFATSPISNKH